MGEQSLAPLHAPPPKASFSRTSMSSFLRALIIGIHHLRCAHLRFHRRHVRGLHVSSSCSDATSSSCAAPIAAPILGLLFTNLHELLPSCAHHRHSSSSLCPSSFSLSPCPGPPCIVIVLRCHLFILCRTDHEACPRPP